MLWAKNEDAMSPGSNEKLPIWFLCRRMFLENFCICIESETGCHELGKAKLNIYVLVMRSNSAVGRASYARFCPTAAIPAC